MEIEVIKSVDDGYSLWNGDKWLADCGKGPEGEDRANAVFDEIVNLQLANENLRAELEATKRVLAAERDIVPAYAVLYGTARLLVEALDANDWSEPGISDELYSAREAVRSEVLSGGAHAHTGED